MKQGPLYTWHTAGVIWLLSDWTLIKLGNLLHSAAHLCATVLEMIKDFDVGSKLIVN